jgi:hypothetical protein
MRELRGSRAQIYGVPVIRSGEPAHQRGAPHSIAGNREIREVISRIGSLDPELRDLARQRRWYRLHLEGWNSHLTPSRLDEAGADELLLEMAPDILEAHADTHSDEPSDRVEIVQLGWERRRSQWGELPVLRGIESIQVRVTSWVPLAAMRVRFD